MLLRASDDLTARVLGMSSLTAHYAAHLAPYTQQPTSRRAQCAIGKTVDPEYSIR